MSVWDRSDAYPGHRAAMPTEEEQRREGRGVASGDLTARVGGGLF